MTVAEYAPPEAEEKEHDAVIVPLEGSVTLDGHEADSPAGVETAKLTGPDNPNWLVNVRVPVEVDPALNTTDWAEML